MMDSATLDGPAAVRNAVIMQAAESLRHFAQGRGFLEAHPCECGRDECPQVNPETMSFGWMVRAIASSWTDAPDPAHEVGMRERLLAVASAFGLDECPEGHADCRCASMKQADARAVVRAVADAWHGRAGNFGPLVPDEAGGLPITREAIGEMATAHAQNLRFLDTLAWQLSPDRAPQFRAVVETARAAEGGAWLEEARALAAEAIVSWLPVPESLDEVRRVLDSALAVAFHADWTAQDARDFDRAAADACTAVLVRGCHHDAGPRCRHHGGCARRRNRRLTPRPQLLG
jgi:hypothetical protein